MPHRGPATGPSAAALDRKTLNCDLSLEVLEKGAIGVRQRERHIVSTAQQLVSRQRRKPWLGAQEEFDANIVDGPAYERHNASRSWAD